jgi:hypothetical protein
MMDRCVHADVHNGPRSTVQQICPGPSAFPSGALLALAVLLIVATIRLVHRRAA